MKNRNPTLAPLERRDSPLATLMEWKVEVERRPYNDHGTKQTHGNMPSNRIVIIIIIIIIVIIIISSIQL